MATTLRSIRVDDLVWARWQSAALTEGISLSDWIRKAADRALTEPDGIGGSETTGATTAAGANKEDAAPGLDTDASSSGSASVPVERVANVARALKTGAAVEGARRDLAEFKPDFKPERKKK